jgi:antitoxin HigA-1
MAMHNPPHPGEFISAVYLEPNWLSGRELATKLRVAPSTLNRVLTGASGVSPEMALRLSKCLGRSAESCLAMQYSHDLWRARQQVDWRPNECARRLARAAEQRVSLAADSTVDNQPVPDTRFRDQVPRPAGIGLQLLPQCLDVGAKAARVRDTVRTPDLA